MGPPSLGRRVWASGVHGSRDTRGDRRWAVPAVPPSTSARGLSNLGLLWPGLYPVKRLDPTLQAAPSGQFLAMTLPAPSRDRVLPRLAVPSGGTALSERRSPAAVPMVHREASAVPQRPANADPNSWDGPACLWVGRGSGRLGRAVATQAPSLAAQPPRWAVSLLWNRLRFSTFSPLSGQRRSRWMPRRPRRGKPDGTKGAGSRSL